MSIELKVFEQMFPTELMQYFSITRFEKLCNIELKKEAYLFYFEEKNILPEGYDTSEYESKDFTQSKTLQDFPLRGKPVFLKVRARRWRHKITHEIIKRDFTYIADSSKLTLELSDFLKGGSRYATRYHEQYSEFLLHTPSNVADSL